MDPSGKARDDEAQGAEEIAPGATEEQAQTSEEAPGEELLELVLAAHEARRAAEEALPEVVEGVVIAKVVSVDAKGEVRVAYPGAPEGGVAAPVMARVTESDVGRDAALLFEGGDRDKPIVVGLLFQRTSPAPALVMPEGTTARVDGERLVLSAGREIVLECGAASITLTREGKILIKGTYVLSRSSGTNRIQGGSVQIN